MIHDSMHGTWYDVYWKYICCCLGYALARHILFVRMIKYLSPVDSDLSDAVKTAYSRRLESLDDRFPDNSFIYLTNKWAGRVFCVVGGFTDTLGFLLLYQSFVASVTGNVVKGAVQAVNLQFATVFFVLSVGYGFGSALARVLSTCLRTKMGYDTLLIGVVLVFSELAALVGAMFICSHMLPSIRTGGEYGFSAIAAGVGMAITMGIQVFEKPSQIERETNFLKT